MNVNIIIPQYHSSHCFDNCIYCGFKKSNKLIPRNRLTDEQFKKELEIILRWGYRTIEFVYASDNFFNADQIAKRIEYAKNLGAQKKINLRIGLNSQSLDYDDYRTLSSAGLDFFVLWMETYSEIDYFYWHGSNTPKSKFQYRFETYERAIEAGIKNYGMGVLFGLSNWKDDVNALINHASILQKKYNISPYIIGVPRIKQAHSVILNGRLKALEDSEFLAACIMYKQAFPNTMLFLNTRESFDLNIKCLNNNDLFTIDCGTYPGAYLNPEHIKNGLEQFHTQFYEKDKIIQQLLKHNITPNFDW